VSVRRRRGTEDETAAEAVSMSPAIGLWEGGKCQY
jgi:hypothetical protein